MDGLTSERFSHKRIDDLFANPISADKGAIYAKHLFLDLSTLSPYVSGPNSVKIATPLDQYVILSQSNQCPDLFIMFREQRHLSVSYLAIRVIY